MQNERLEKQIEFIIEIDKLKSIVRQTYIANGSRNENDSEHSWHLAMMAMLLHEHIDGERIDMVRVLKMVLIHDLVEIDAGDTYCYDSKASEDKDQREKKAADRIFGILPPEQAKELRNIWDEFEERKTPEACFAAALDRLQPLLLHIKNCGKSWKMNGIRFEQAFNRMNPISDSSHALWNYALEILNDSLEKGYLAK